MPRAGIVTIVGKPNAGKSTLLNRIIGQKLSITSAKPQSTRDRIVGIHTTPDTQIVFLDTPGLLEPQYALHQTMRATALRAIEDADVVLYLADATEGPPPPLADIAGLTAQPKAPTVLALNKVDRLKGDRRAELERDQPNAAFISATSGKGLEPLLQRITTLLPESPFLYPEDELSTQSLRFFAAELIRETALEQLDEEVPYSVACEIEEFREGRTPVYIRANLYVERAGQKAILLGDKGSRIREIGRASRMKIESLLGSAVYLDLWVKILPNWRKNPHALARLGYRPPSPEDTRT